MAQSLQSHPLATDVNAVLAQRALIETNPDGTPTELVVDASAKKAPEPCPDWQDRVPVQKVNSGTFNARVLDRFADEITEQAINVQSSVFPELSAKTVFSTWQKLLIGAVIVLCVGLSLTWPRNFAIGTMAIVTGVMFVASVFKAILIVCSIRNTGAQSKPTIEHGDDLPSFDILFPLFREKEMVPRLLRVVENLNYPRDKVKVMFVIEEEDHELNSLFAEITLPENVSFLRVPSSYPQTKPKAINVALMMCAADIVSVFDAEDQIEPDHLRQIAHAFKTGGDRLACVQTALVFQSNKHNWLTKQFTLEYSVWYNLVLPSISWLGLPVPLGGTGNHFNRRILNEVGAWDCYNVTEDADLGMRLHFCGYRVQVLPIATIEDPNPNAISWIKQRSRWIKGHMQTYIIYMRQPLRTLRRFGIASFLALQFLFGLTFVIALLNPLIWLLFLIWLLTQTNVLDFAFPPATLMIGTFNLLVMNSFFVLTGLLAASYPGREQMAGSAFTTIIYGFLSSAAAFIALWQLIIKPHYWEKTDHPVLEEVPS